MTTVTLILSIIILGSAVGVLWGVSKMLRRVERIGDSFSGRLVMFMDLLTSLRPDAFKDQVGEIRLMFQHLFTTVLQSREADLLRALEAANALIDRQRFYNDELGRRVDQIENHSRQAYIRLQTLSYLIRPLADSNQAESTSLASRPQPDMIEVIDPSGSSEFYPAPVRPDEAVHMDICKALVTPGYRIRYPDGREEKGIC